MISLIRQHPGDWRLAEAGVGAHLMVGNEFVEERIGRLEQYDCRCKRLSLPMRSPLPLQDSLRLLPLTVIYKSIG